MPDSTPATAALPSPSPSDSPPGPLPEGARVLVVGGGRMGTVLVPALRAAGFTVDGPVGRGATGSDADVVLLAVPDAAIASAAELIHPGPAVGHLSGATGLQSLGTHRDAFSLHPLLTVTGARSTFAGATAAVDGQTERARAIARSLAHALGLRPIRVAPQDRVAYHTAATVAANFLVTLEAAAERIAATAGVDRAALVPLVRMAVENWAELGGERALTGPIVRGDAAVVAAQRTAITDRVPELLDLFDALVAATQSLAERRGGGEAP